MPESDSFSASVAEDLSNAERHALASQWPEADACFNSAIARDVTAASRIAFANSLASREQYNGAICQFTAALDMTSSRDREALGVIFHNLAAIYRELGDADLARRFQQRALLQMDDCGPDELLGLANDAWLSERIELACCLASTCVEVDTDESLACEIQAMFSMMTALDLDDPRTAIRPLIRVYRQHQLNRDERLMGIDLLNLSALLSAEGRHQTEIRLVRRAIDHFENAPAPVSAARAREILANLQRMQSLREFDSSLN